MAAKVCFAALRNLTRLPLTRTSNALPAIYSSNLMQFRCFGEDRTPGPKKWFTYNDVVHPPQLEHEERRPAWVCHARSQIKYSPKKMWYIATLIRGMSIDEALKQLSFLPKNGATVVKEVLLEAQELAINEHNVEYKSNLWVAESFVTKGRYVKGLRKHARQRFGIVKYRYCHYYVKLQEGDPPEHYYPIEGNGHEKLQEWLTEFRNKRVILTL